MFPASNRAALRYATAAFMCEEPQEYESVNELALKWGRDRIVRFSCLIFALVVLVGISALYAQPHRGTPIVFVALLISWVWRGGNTIRHYLTFKRKMDLIALHESRTSLGSMA